MTKMHRVILTSFLLLLSIGSTSTLQAQYYYFSDKFYDKALVFETGASFGFMNALTDLGGKKGTGKNFTRDLNWKNTKPCFSLFILAMYKYKLGIKLESFFGQVQAADNILQAVAASSFGRYERNLSFKSHIRELQLSIEVHPLFFHDFEKYEPPHLSPYVFTGIGYFSFQPIAQLSGQWYMLQPLHTEGQGTAAYPDRKPYKLKQFNLPLGMGLRYEIGTRLSARLEINHRILFTDYLDDVSKDYVNPGVFAQLPAQQAAIARQLFDRQGELDPGHVTQVGGQRGDPTHNDAYFSLQVKVGISLRRPYR